MNKYLLSFFAIALLFISCTKEATYNIDNVKPVIKVVYPTDNPIIPAGYPLCVKVLISDTESLSTVWLEINDGYGFKKEFTANTRSLEIIEKYTAPSGVTGNMIAKFTAVDEAGNVSSEEIKFAVNN